MKIDFNLEEDRVLLFIDLLGFSNLVIQNEKEELGDITLQFTDLYRNIMVVRYDKEEQLKKKIKCAWASDTIIISAHKSNFDILIEELQYLHNMFLVSGIAFRGCLTFGSLHHNDNEIWGEPLVMAAKLEKSKVSFPRVIISIADFKSLQPKSKYEKYFEPCRDELSIEYIEFNAFSACFDCILEKKASIEDAIITYKEEIVSGYRKADEKVKDKWSWL